MSLCLINLSIIIFTRYAINTAAVKGVEIKFQCCKMAIQKLKKNLAYRTPRMECLGKGK